MPAANTQDLILRCTTLLTPHESLQDVLLHIVDGTIRQIEPFGRSAAAPTWYDPELTVMPGFIETHVHGALGQDVMEGTLDAVQSLSHSLASHGTTSFLATTLSAPDSDIIHALKGFRECHRRVDGAAPRGIHLEGPFLSPNRKGTHNGGYLKPGDPALLRRFVEASGDTVRKITIAPEVDPDLAVIRECVARKIHVSLGHSNATFEQTRAAIDAGADQATHTFNAMRPFHHRDPGIMGAVLTDPRISAELIADGIHVHREAIRLLWHLKGPERVLLVTDGLSAVDMPDGEYPLGDKRILVRNGECRDSEGVLSGSVLTQDRAVRNMVEWLKIPLFQALIAATAVPARNLGIDIRAGRIAPGADADLVFLDSDLRVRRTMVRGRIVFQAGLTA